MTAAETIAAAIEKLDRERARATDAPWRINTRSPLSDTVGIGNSVGRQIAHYVADPDAELIVTLRRTIDAQLAILRHGLELMTPWAGMVPLDETVTYELVLARAILGES